VDILQPCVTFNHLNTFKWYSERVYKLDENEYPLNDRVKAFEKSLEWGEHIPIGVFYVNDRPVFEESLDVLSSGPLIRNKVKTDSVNELIDGFM
jgi:2-oxoglutarate ferredoxin oxidoreductase subunit beta